MISDAVKDRYDRAVVISADTDLVPIIEAVHNIAPDKEVGVALINGMLWGGVMGTITWALYGALSLGLIMFSAMVLNLLLAAMAGALVPMVLKRIGQDPALGSSIILTGFTDSFGFLIFLGLAASFLRT